MGPRPFGRGRPGATTPPKPFTSASMGPRPFGRGRQHNPTYTAGKFMLLQWGRDLSVAEGSSSEAAAGADSCSLQWGRDLSVAEGCRRQKRRRRDRQLQWGRDLSVAEGSPDLWNQLSPGVCFNGAATFRSRKGGVPRPAQHALDASMGPRPFGRGRLQPGQSLSRSGGASMGPRPFGRGRRLTAGEFEAWARLQWGRDLSVAEGI